MVPESSNFWLLLVNFCHDFVCGLDPEFCVDQVVSLIHCKSDLVLMRNQSANVLWKSGPEYLEEDIVCEGFLPVISIFGKGVIRKSTLSLSCWPVRLVAVGSIGISDNVHEFG
jgi:hypothetical protein